MADHPQTTLAEARALAAFNEPLPEAFYIDREGEVQFKPGPLAAARKANEYVRAARSLTDMGAQYD